MPRKNTTTGFPVNVDGHLRRAVEAVGLFEHATVMLEGLPRLVQEQAIAQLRADYGEEPGAGALLDALCVWLKD